MTPNITAMRGPPVPDAGASYFGTYGIRNPWVLWLLSIAPELCADLPTDRLQPLHPPRCPECQRPMVYRPGRWRCYRCDATIPQTLTLSPAPAGDMLARTAEALDYVYDEDLGGWAIIPLRGV